MTTSLRRLRNIFKLFREVFGLKRANVVGTAMRTDYGRDVSMLDMIIVANSERRNGLGCELFTI